VLDLGSGVLMPGLIDAYSTAGIAGNAAEMTREITPATAWSGPWTGARVPSAPPSPMGRPAWGSTREQITSSRACRAVKTAGGPRVVQSETGLLITMASDPASGNNSRQRPDTIYVRQPTNRMGVVWMLQHLPQGHAAQRRGTGRGPRGSRRQARIYAVSRAENDLVSLLRLARSSSSRQRSLADTRRTRCATSWRRRRCRSSSAR
jgi:hypothetical protein